MKKNRYTLIHLILYFNLIIWIAFIFYNSLLTGNDSGEKSGQIVSILMKNLEVIGLDIRRDLLSTLIRKLAHFIEFMFLGMIANQLVYETCSKVKGFIKVLVILFIALFVATIDEVIQYFIPGRASSVIDVFIDFSGAVVSIFLVYLIRKIKKERLIVKC